MAPTETDRSSDDRGGDDRSGDDRRHGTVLAFEYDTEERARIVAGAITQELHEIADDRTGASVERDGVVLRIRIGADNLVGLRAGLNTWLTLVEVAERAADAGTSAA